VTPKRAARRLLVALDRLTLCGIAAGLALELQPFWSDGLRVGFLVTLAAVVLQILFAHLVAAPAHQSE
jgi:hypothetical protein